MRSNIIWVVALAAVLATVACKKSDDGETPQRESATAEGPVTGEVPGHVFDPGDRWNLADSPVKGSTDAYVTIVEWSSFQCGFCGRVQPTLEEILNHEEFGDRVRLVFKQHPLDFQARSRPAAIASLAAHRQGKFWEYHDMIFDNMQTLSDADLARFAQEIGLDTEQFATDIQDPVLAQQVDADTRLAGQLGLQGTPNFMINGRNLVGAQPIDGFASIIREEITAMQGLIDGGMSVSEAYGARLDANAAAAPPTPPTPTPPTPPAPAQRVEINVDGYPTIGPDDAILTLVEYSDYTCGFCGRFHHALYDVLGEDFYGGRVRVVFKHFPRGTPDIAIAATAAHRQGKFWEFSDRIFDENVRDRAGFERLATELGLNMDQFRADLDDPAVREDVMAQRAEGAGFGVSGTPTWFLNGYRHVGFMEGDRLRGVLDAAIANPNAPPPSAAPPTPPPTPTGPVEINIEGAPVIGPADAALTLVEYSDYTCGFCGRFHHALYDVLGEDFYGGRVRVVFKHFPRGNPDIAIAATAAHRQGKFWEFSDRIFDENVRDRAGFERLATELGLNMDQFRADLDDPAVREDVMAQRAEGAGFGVSGTPTWFLNGHRHVGFMEGDRLRGVLDAALQDL